jgi:hypothetical protein
VHYSNSVGCIARFRYGCAVDGVRPNQCVINAFNGSKIVVTGLAWRSEVCQQVFEEAAVDARTDVHAAPAARTDDAREGAVPIT